MHKDIKMDWSHVSIPNKANKYDSMMKGLTSGPMKDAMKTMTENLEKEGKKLSSAQERDVAAVSDFIYIRSFDDGSELGNVFK
jgi:hypothetical protein